MKNRSKLLAVLEVLSAYAAGTVVGLLVARLLGVRLGSPLAPLATEANPDLVSLSWMLLKVLFWQYAGWGLCAVAAWLALRRDGRVPAPAAAPRLAAPRLFLLGGVAGALTAIPALVVTFLQAHFHLGETAPWRAALLARPWDAPFWLFMAVGSFALVPILEEGFYRGYLFRRLERSWRPATAVVFSAALFAFSHGQYARLDALNVLTLATVLWSGVVYAIVTRMSGSLLPAILGHALVNVPISSALLPFAAATLLLVLALAWRRWADLRAHAAALLADPRWPAIAAALGGGAAFAFVFQKFGEPLALAGILALPAVLFAARGRRVASLSRGVPASLGCGGR